jgi:hypothetical protein
MSGKKDVSNILKIWPRVAQEGRKRHQRAQVFHHQVGAARVVTPAAVS